MKYKNKPLIQKNSTVVRFFKDGEELEFIVSPLPMGWWNQMQTIGVSSYPKPKLVPLRDPKKDIYVVNKNTGKVETVEDRNDPEYLKQVALVGRRLRVLQLVTHLRDDQNVEFESKKPETYNVKDWQDYADKLNEELLGTSLTEEEISKIVDEGEKLGCVLDIEAIADDELLSPT
jgi:hypothetical protein